MEEINSILCALQLVVIFASSVMLWNTFKYRFPCTVFPSLQSQNWHQGSFRDLSPQQLDPMFQALSNWKRGCLKAGLVISEDPSAYSKSMESYFEFSRRVLDLSGKGKKDLKRGCRTISCTMFLFKSMIQKSRNVS